MKYRTTSFSALSVSFFSFQFYKFIYLNAFKWFYWFYRKVIKDSFYRLITSAVDLKLIFFAESCEEGATSDHNIKKQLKGHIEGVFLSKTKDTLTLATSFQNTNQLKT